MKYLFCFLLLSSSFFITAQQIYGIDNWEFHFPYNRLKFLTVADNKVYAATDNSIFYFDKDDNQLQKFTPKDGLSDIEVSAMEYNSNLKTLVIGYVSGKIDLVINNEIISIDDIFRASIIGSKKINHIFFHQNIAYLSTDFGLIQLDIKKYEIKDTYRNIGVNGKQLEIFESTINPISQEIFVICTDGLRKASTKNTNLLDFKNWSLEKDTSAQITHISTLNNITYSFSKKNNVISYLKNNDWITVVTDELKDKNVKTFRLNPQSNSILTTFNHNILQIKDTNSVGIIDGYTWDPQNALLDNRGFLWINTVSDGLRTNYFGEWTTIFPSGPKSNDVFRFYHYDTKQYVLRGGYSSDAVIPNWRSPEYYIYDNQKWENTATEKGIGLTDMVINPANDYTYFSSFTGGVIYKKPDGTYGEWTTNTEGIPLKGLNRIPCVELDNKNNVWLTSFLAGGNPSLYKIDKNNVWTAYLVNSDYADVFVDLTIDDFDVKWLRIKGSSNRNGIYIFDEKTNQGRYLTNSFTNGNLPSATINDIKKDKENRIWVATNNGVAVFDNRSGKVGNISTSEVFNLSVQSRLPIVVEQGLPMLLGEVANCIFVDGANRKWVGTNSGLWLFNENGTIILKKFDTKNSPLPTNEITSLDINGKTGELFIGTSFGVISYWEGTTEAKPTHESELKIFPNPVRLSENQSVTIQGLAENATVKITDITGRIITEKRALGGTAIWNGYNVNGLRASTGIYLIYSVSADGEEGFVGKFALIE